MTVAEYIANQLYKKGIRQVFGVPGGSSIPYIEALNASGIEFILTGNESSAGIMAAVIGRLTGIPGVCHSTFGPGATNLTTGAGAALLDRCPVILLTCEMDDRMLYRTTQMNINHQKLFEPLVKATFRLTPDNTSEVLERTFELCAKEYPGPVHIGLPSDLAQKEIHLKGESEKFLQKKTYRKDIEKIASVLSNAGNPVIAAGLTAARFRLKDKLLNFLESHAMPVVITPMAKGLLPEDNQCYAGVLFHAMSDSLQKIISKSDLIIGLGYDPVEFNYESWMPDVPLLHFDTRETDMPGSIRNIQVSDHPEVWFKILNENLQVKSFMPSFKELSCVKNEIKSAFKRFEHHFGPVSALKTLMDELPDDIMVTADVGSHLHLIGQYWCTKGKSNLIMTNGWSGMGFGLPAALAASISGRNSRAVCITGDGGFLMSAGEIITARRYNLPVIVVVLSDKELNLIKLKKSWQNLGPSGTILYTDDLFGTDTFLGIKVLTAESHKSMKMALKTALQLNEPVIINARIDPEDYKWLIVKR